MGYKKINVNRCCIYIESKVWMKFKWWICVEYFCYCYFVEIGFIINVNLD